LHYKVLLFMNIFTAIGNYYIQAKGNSWFRRFTVFCRVALAAGFIPAGYVKIIDERFTDLPNNQPMGHYLEALSLTGYYYPFIGVVQALAGLMLLIPRTATLAALLYLPIILNITILSLAVRFEGSLLTAPMMVLANLYLICWDYDKLRLIFPWNNAVATALVPKPEVLSRKFPFGFAGGVLATIVLYVFTITHVYNLMPRNNLQDCKRQCSSAKNPKACDIFCECIHTKGQPLDKSLDAYEKAK
jgi:uncharacterized membrane protein YphA (DoxX/SURF4 family)